MNNVKKGFSGTDSEGNVFKDGRLVKFGSHPNVFLEIVGSCPKCGAPIYGDKTVLASMENGMRIKYACECHKFPLV